MDKPLVIYHGRCADGFTAAWVANLAFSGIRPGDLWPTEWHVDAHPGVYGEVPPDCTGRNVFLVDFSYPRAIVLKMAETANSITIIDHHATALNDLRNISQDAAEGDYCPIELFGSIERSGAYLTWVYFFDDFNIPPPDIVKLVDDRDRWVFADPRSRPFAAGLFAREYTLADWNYAAGHIDQLIADGDAIDRKAIKDIRELLDQMTVYENIAGHRVPTANLSYMSASDACHELLQRFPEAPFAATWFLRADGRRVFSLRSRTGSEVDVGEIAKALGGGGHKHASGFTMATEE